MNLTCSCGKRRRLSDESPDSHGPECCTCPKGTRVHLWGCLASYICKHGVYRIDCPKGCAPALVAATPYST